MRLTPEEGRCAAELTPELWQRGQPLEHHPCSPVFVLLYRYWVGFLDFNYWDSLHISLYPAKG